MADDSLVHKPATDEEFNMLRTSSGDKLQVVDFWAGWCRPCKAIKPKFEEMAKEFTDMVFIAVDVDELDDTATALDIDVMPTFIIFKGDEKVATLLGPDAAKLRAKLEEVRAAHSSPAGK